MGQVRITTTVAAPPEAVWALLVDPSRFSEWQASTAQVLGGDERLDRLGASYTVVSRLRSRSAAPTAAPNRSADSSPWRTRMMPPTLRTTNWLQGRWRVTRVIPHRLLELTGTAPGGARGVLTQLVEPSGSGTAYTIELVYELPVGFLGAIADRMFVERVLQRDFQDSGENLNRLLNKPDSSA